jgi:iron complex transport system permease protein
MRMDEKVLKKAEGIEATYSRREHSWKLLLILLAASLILVIILSLNIGYARIPLLNILRILFKRVPFLSNLVDVSNISKVDETIITKIRVPRVLAAALVGSALAAAGVIYQGIFKNPMADPYVLGVSAGAAVGASIAIVLGVAYTFFGLSTVSILAFVSSLVTIYVVYNISKVGVRTPVTNLLLSGMAVSIFLSAFLAILQIIAGEKLHIIVFWLMGGFSIVEWREIWAIITPICLGIAASFLYTRDLNIFSLGEESAQYLGVEVEKVKQILLVIASLVTASAVSISGLIGFIGLIVPHMIRLVIGPDHRILLPTSILFGAIFLVISDSIARVIVQPVELPVGVITALAGGPFFIYLLRKKKESYSF